MPRSFSSATAEQVIAAVEAVVVNNQPTNADFVADFSDLPRDRAEAALALATDLGFLTDQGGRQYLVYSPLCRFVVTSSEKQKAAVLRVVLESYHPFVTFRDRLIATNLAATAAQQTKVVLDLDAHREAIKDTLISLGTYSHALVTEGGGRYRLEYDSLENPLETLAQACRDIGSAELRIREQIGAESLNSVSQQDVISPLADALLRAQSADARGAVVTAGNAIESHLVALAGRLGVSLAGATGINAKLDKLSQARKFNKKLVNVGKYLGHVRNAADHGIDADVGAPWTIRYYTGLEYVFVACSFLSATTAAEMGRSPEV